MTELTWEGKYTKDGKKVSPFKVALPFQTVETVNESAQERQQTLELFARGKPSAWRNHLIWGDKKYVLPSLLPEFAGKVNLIYIDPPFDTGADFSFTAQVPAYEDEENAVSFVKQPSLLEQKAYRDTWGKGLDSYLQWFYETVVLLRELLAENGSIYVHLDEHIGHYAKIVLDEVFGIERFLNDIIWHYPDNFQGNVNRFANNHNMILVYGKTEQTKLKRIEIPLDKTVKRDVRIWDKEKGKVTAARDEEGNIIYREYNTKFADDVWQIGQTSVTKKQSNEFLGYPTQKPEALLERIIKASSNENDLILDCFCGSGTTAAVAEKLNRRWIVCDLGRFAIHTTRKRLLSNPQIKPFCVQNLGKYERQHWMTTELTQDTALQHLQTYRYFMLNLYHADPLQGYTWLHGKKANRIIHIGSVDAPISYSDIQAIVKEFWQTVGKNTEFSTNGLDILGWDFAFELHETTQQFAHANKIDLKFKRIPREVLEKRAVEQGDIKFFELAALAVKTTLKKQKLTLTLENFIIVPDDVPQDLKITHWSQWIDYWAVDFVYKNDTFHNEWQSYRTKKNPKIDLAVTHTYQESAKYMVMVKVIDVLGNDTTKILEIVV